MKKILIVFLILCIAVLTNFSVLADSYTYNTQGNAVSSPDAFIADADFSGIDIGAGAMSNPTDLKISKSGRVAISDTGNSRVILSDIEFKSSTELKVFERDGHPDELKNPTGLFFTQDEHLYVCDQDNKRIVEFDEQLRFVRTIENPREELLPEGFSFYPSAVAVDKWGTVYCISHSSINGYLQFDSGGEFKGFMGSPEITMSLTQKMWRSLQSKEQRKRTAYIIPVNFNNLAVDEEGFVYTTEINPDKENTAVSIQSGAKSGLFMPVKKFNFNGEDVLKRLGSFAPAGDISFEKSYPEGEKESGELWASNPVSITLAENGIYYIADAKRNKIFGYDQDGNLLYAFAGTGSMTGLFSKLAAIEYHDNKLYALDINYGSVTRFSMTDYGKLLHNTIDLSARRQYDEAAENWNLLLSQNQNLTAAYIGIGRVYLEQQKYDDAMEYFRLALDMDGYTDAFSRQRDEVLRDWFLLVPLTILFVVLAVGFAIAKMNRYNAKGKLNLSGHLIYAQHVVFHPFDGFWDIVHEKRGSTGAAAIFLSLAAICLGFKNQLSGFAITGGSTQSPFLTTLVILGVALVFCVANWCLTSLANGKGRFKDIFTVVGYSAVPLIVFSVPVTILSNFLTANEAGILTILMYIAYLWTAFLLFTGIMTVQQYSLGQNIFSTVFTLVGMAVIVFLAFLLVNLIGRISGFFVNLLTEIRLR